MEHSRLFHEGGNYSAEEGKMFASRLETVDKYINTGIKNVLKEIVKDESEIMKKTSSAFAPTIFL